MSGVAHPPGRGTFEGVIQRALVPGYADTQNWKVPGPRAAVRACGR